MSNRPEPFECRWRASRRLLAAYLIALALAVISLLLAAIPLPGRIAAFLLCVLHASWVLPRHVLLRSPGAWTGLRHSAEGWQLWSAQRGWQPVQLRHDSLALPHLIVLRFRRPGRYFSEGVCVPLDSLAPEIHRRLRVRLRFSRGRWADPG